MALRPFAFGARLRDGDRTVRVRASRRDPRQWVLEDVRRGRATRHRDHPTLGGALADLARTWRGRLQ